MRLLNKKIVITELQLPDIKPATAIVSYENDKADRVELFYSDSKYVVGNIYVAHVNIQQARKPICLLKIMKKHFL